MNLVDTHCHIQSAGNSAGEPTTGDLWAKAPQLTGDKIIANAVAAEVTKMICVGCDPNDSRLAVDFARDRQNCWASIGIHPHEAQHYASQPAKLKEFARLLAAPKIVAVGECGLDYFYNHSPREAQIEILKFQIRLAQAHDLPIIFHVREAFEDFWPVFDELTQNGEAIRGVLHSFTDSQANLERAINHGLYIGVNGIATFARNTEQLEMYKAIPLQKLLLETDAPFLTPAPYRGTINEVKHVRTTAEFLVGLRGEPLDQLATETTANAEQLFGLD